MGLRVQELDLGLKYLSGTGQTLNVAEVTGLTGGLTRLQQQQGFSEVFFWGKCLGTERDYYVSYGLRPGELVPTKQFFWAGPGFAFAEMPAWTEADLPAIAAATGPLIGSPEKDVGSEEGALRESLRLAYAVAQIDHDTSAVPAGAYAK